MSAEPLPPPPPVPLDDTAEDLFEDAPCGYVTASPDGTILRVNRTFTTWGGWTADDLVGRRRLQDLLTAGGRIYHETHYAPLLRMQGSVREIAVDFVAADGRRLPALVSSVLRTDEHGAPVVVRTAVFDAASRREYEAELLRALRRAEASEARARVLAQTLQASLIPPAPPEIPGVELGAVYRPAGTGDQVGGDFYDVFEVARGDWGVVVGDVCGKGPEAAGVTAMARYTIRAAAMRNRRPRVILGMLNDALLRQHVERFCTVICGRLRISSNGRVRLTLASGGHPLPLHATPSGTVQPLGRPGGIIGAFEGPELHDATAELHPGDAVVLFTDGVTEARRGDDLFGDARLGDALVDHRHLSAQCIAEGIVERATAFQEGLPRDDTAVLVVKVPDAP